MYAISIFSRVVTHGRTRVTSAEIYPCPRVINKSKGRQQCTYCPAKHEKRSFGKRIFDRSPGRRRNIILFSACDDGWSRAEKEI